MRECCVPQVLGAENLVDARLGRFEPDLHEPAGHNVGFDTERRYREIMNDVLRCHDQLDRAPDRDVQLVDLALSGRMLHFPHPLLADDIDVERLGRRVGHREIYFGAPQENDDRDEKRNHGPAELQQQPAMNLCADLIGMPPPESDGEKDDQRRDEERQDDGEADQKEVQRVDFSGDCGRAFRKQREPEHDPYPTCLRSRLVKTKISVPSKKTVAPPASCTIRRIARL